MDLWSLVQIVWRRWYVVLPLVALTIYSSMATTSSISPEYTAQGSVILVGPQAGAETVADNDEIGVNNRLLQLGGSLGTVAEVLGLSLSSQQTRQEFAAQGLVPDYEIGTDSRSPIMLFEASDSDPDRTAATMTAIIEYVEQQLDLQQEAVDVPVDELIELRRISSGNDPIADFSGQQRTRLMYIGLGLLLTIAVTLAVDIGASWLRRRRRHDTAPGDVEAVEPTEPVPADAVDGSGVPSPEPVVVAAATNGHATRTVSTLSESEAAELLPSLNQRERRLLLYAAKRLDDAQVGEVITALGRMNAPDRCRAESSGNGSDDGEAHSQARPTEISPERAGPSPRG